ncbi:MAG TPA: allantoinase AllB [Gemmatimonadales bacterium]|nr:allantoinase AllB [Gemmatimonadales bacterium]
MTGAVRSRRLVTPDGMRPGTLLFDRGIISSIAPWDHIGPETIQDVGDAVVSPALVDTHVHINEPGRTDWEGFSFATQAAAAGGVATLIDMPLNSVPPTTSVPSLREKREAAIGQCAVDVGFLAGVVPGNARELRHLQHAGVFGFKAFMCDSGVAEFPPVSNPDLRQALLMLASLDALLMVHAEDPSLLRAIAGTARRHEEWLATRPASAEMRAVEDLIALAREFGARIHVVHVSAPDTARRISEARDRGVRITGETCPHYLTFCAEEIPEGATGYKCAPPIRSRESREGLWDALRRDWIDVVVTDHSPVPPSLKLPEVGDFFAAWGGIASLQLRLPAVWTSARERGFTIEDVARWTAEAPARLVGLEGRKGRLVPGADADFVIWQPEEEFTVDEAGLRHRHKLTPWLGRRLAGVVEATYLRGEPVFRRGEPDPPMRGTLIERMNS